MKKLLIVVCLLAFALIIWQRTELFGKKNDPLVGRISLRMIGAYVNNQQVPSAPGTNKYLGVRFDAVDTKTVWRATPGRFQSGVGYWIFRTDMTCGWNGPYGSPAHQPPAPAGCQAIQAPSAFGALSYWNRDGRAQGTPQDYELFQFIPVQDGRGGYKVANNRVTQTGNQYHLIYNDANRRFEMANFRPLDYAVFAISREQ